MKRTWRPPAAGILCIIAGAIGAICGIVYFPLVIAGVTAIVGGIYALRRRTWGLALAGSICILIQGILMALLWVGFLWEGHGAFPTVFLVAAIIILGIPGVLAIIFVIKGKCEFAADELNRAIELNPNSADVYCKRGDAYSEIGEYEKALADYSKAMELKPDDALAYFNRGNAYAEIGEYDKAIADYSKTIELDPGDADSHYNRGLTYREKGDLLKAVSDLEKCIELSTDPELTEAAGQTLHEIADCPRDG